MIAFLLAGPIVRRVDVRTVCVWVATSEAADLKLTLFEGIAPVGVGAGLVTLAARNTSTVQRTVRVGKALHVGLVELTLSASEQLLPGQAYSYNVVFTLAGEDRDLKSLGLLGEGPLLGKPHVPLGYDANTLPSFAALPARLEEVHLYHASCRKPHGQDPDALGFLDEEIKAGRADVSKRPHQLFLTGDQIYADDVPISLLPHLSKVGRELIGANERLPVGPGVTVDVSESTLPPGFRSWFAREFVGLSSSEMDSHLLSLGEYCAAYLFAFSNVLWPDLTQVHTTPETIPKVLADIVHTYAIKPEHLAPWPDEEPKIDRPFRDALFDPARIGDLVQFVNQLTVEQRAVIESKTFEHIQDDLIGLTLGTDPVPASQSKLAFLVEQARTLAPPGSVTAHKRSVQMFFWFIGIRRAAWRQVRVPDNRQPFLRQTMAAYHDALPKVRRVLANLPTYMIGDDHDVTDDWNVSRSWRAGILGKPLGRAVLRNAIAAYGMMQGWGNDPLQFVAGVGANGLLINRIPELYEAAAMGSLPVGAGVPPKPEAAAVLDQLFGLDDSIPTARWDFEAPGTDFRTIVLDTRTRRDFPGVKGAPALLSQAALEQQVPEGPLPAGKRVLIVVSPAPVLDLAVLEEFVKPVAIRITDVMHARKNEKGAIEGDMAFDLESWSAHPPGFERLIARLAKHERVLVLSGDVHFGQAADLTYWRREVLAGPPLRVPVDPDDPALQAWGAGLKLSRVVQFTSSAAKNQVPMAEILFLLAKTTFAQQAQRVSALLERLGWEEASTEPIEPSATESTLPQHRARLGLSPVLVPADGWPAGTGFLPFEWAWRVRLRQDVRPDSERPPLVQPLPIAVPATVGPENAFEVYRAVARRHVDALRSVTFSRQMTMATNVGRVSFDSSSGKLEAVQDLLAVHPEDPLLRPVPYTQHRLSLDPVVDPLDPPFPFEPGGPVAHTLFPPVPRRER